MNDSFVGSLTFARIYSGVLEGGSSVMNTVKGKRERVGRMLLMHANSREDIKEARAGDIVAIAGLKGTTTTGDTLCDPERARGAGAHRVPRSGHRDRGRAEDQGRPGKDGRCARSAGRKTPRSGLSTDHESGQTILKGMGELHLEIIIDRMKREFKVDANIGAPQVAYREAITAGRSRSITRTRSRPAAQVSSRGSR